MQHQEMPQKALQKIVNKTKKKKKKPKLGRKIMVVAKFIIIYPEPREFKIERKRLNSN